MEPKTITTDDGTFALTDGLREFAASAGAVRCDDCNMWAYAGSAIRHSKRCDTPNLQAVAVSEPGASVSSSPSLSWTTTKRGRRVVVGPVGLVVVGAVLEVGGAPVTIAGVGRAFERPAGPHCYGYTTATAATTRSCDECGYSHGHRMDCALAD